MQSPITGLFLQTKQWGVQTTINRNTTTPITLALTMPNTDYCCILTQNLNGSTYAREYLNGGAIYSRTATTLTIYTYSAEYAYNWIVIGRQQWGLANLNEHDAVRTISFPISYTSTVFSVTAYCYANNHSNEYINNAWTEKWSTSSFVFKQYQYASEYSWLSVGV